MLHDMRTTFIFDDELYLQVIRVAVEQRRTATSVVEEALRKFLAETPDPMKKEPFYFKPMGEGGMRPGVDLTDSDQIYQILDEEEFVSSPQEVLVG